MRKLVKGAILGVFYIAVAPFGFTARFACTTFGVQELFNTFAQLFSLLPGRLGRYVRVCYYAQALDRSHMDADFLFGSVVTQPGARIGRRAVVGCYVRIGLADLDDEAAIGNRSTVLSGRHHHNFRDPTRPIFHGTNQFLRVTIGRRTFIGDSCVVMANVGAYTIVGAGSVVVKELPDHVVAAGNPARILKERTSADPPSGVESVAGSSDAQEPPAP